MEIKRRVNPACPNAGNPFHQYGDYCAGVGGRRIAVIAGKSPVVNGEGARVEGRVVDPNCVNAVNPFHQCVEYCTKKAAETKKRNSRLVKILNHWIRKLYLASFDMEEQIVR